MKLAPSLPIPYVGLQSCSGRSGAAAAITISASTGSAMMGAHPSSESPGLLIRSVPCFAGANFFLAVGAVDKLGSEGTGLLYGRGVHTPRKLQKTPLASLTVVFFAVAAAAATAPALRHRRENLLCALLSAERPSVGNICGRPMVAATADILQLFSIQRKQVSSHRARHSSALDPKLLLGSFPGLLV